MSRRLVLGLSCALVLMACGSKDPNGEDGGLDEAGAGGKGSGRDAGKEPRDSGGESGDSGSATGNPSDAAAHDAGSGDECGGAYLPMAVGNRWTYRVISPVEGASMKVNTIDGEELVGGTGPNADKTAFHALTTKMSGVGMDMTESWQGVLPDGSVVRYREIAYKAGSTQANGEDHWDPYKLRFDQSPEHIVAGATWDERYTETKIDKGVPVSAIRDDGWVVDGVDVPCGPVDGEMLSCIKVSKTADGAETGKSYWYARCVGKVREQGTQVEELISYELR